MEVVRNNRTERPSLRAGPFAFNPPSPTTTNAFHARERVENGTKCQGDRHVRIPSNLPSPPPCRQALRLARPPRRAVLLLPPPHAPPAYPRRALPHTLRRTAHH